MKDFKGKLAVVTGAGTGMGRELARQLVSDGCNVAMCDVLMDNLAETQKLCEEQAAPNTLVTSHKCDVSVEEQVIAFRDEIKAEHKTEHINLLFNNAGIGGAGSFILDDRADWDRTFGICWFGVYYCSRAFLPMLLASDEGHLINTSSVNGFWASLGPDTPHTAYSSAKFAVKGFSEALINDLRLYAPHVKVSVVMPGHIGTSIAINGTRVLGKVEPEDMTPEDFAQWRQRMEYRVDIIKGLSDEQLIKAMKDQKEGFRDNAPVSSAEAATVILDGVRNEQWRILIGVDAHAMDRLVREDPESAYTQAFMERLAGEAEWALSQTVASAKK